MYNQYKGITFPCQQKFPKVYKIQKDHAVIGKSPNYDMVGFDFEDAMGYVDGLTHRTVPCACLVLPLCTPSVHPLCYCQGLFCHKWLGISCTSFPSSTAATGIFKPLASVACFWRKIRHDFIPRQGSW